MSGAPMVITLYDKETDEAKSTFTRSFVPWKILKRAVGLAKELDASNLTPADIDSLTGLVIEVFGDRFSKEELESGADLGEMMTVINQIVAKAAGGIKVNPTEQA